MVFDDDGGGVIMGLIRHGNEGIELAFETLAVTDHIRDLTVLVVLGILDAAEAVEHRTDIGDAVEVEAVTLLGGLFLRAVDVVHSHGYSYDKEETFDNEQSTLYHCYQYLSKHRQTSVITYNYDTNLEYLLKKKDIRYTVVYDESSFVDKEAQVDIYHVHGLLPYGKSKEKRYTDSLVFTESDYYYLYNNPYSWNIAKQLHDFKFNACLFIGISLTDPDRKRILELARNYLKFNFIFLKKENGYSTSVYRNLTTYFFTFDLIVIWVDDYSEIGVYLSKL